MAEVSECQGDRINLWSYISGLREDLGRAEERIRELEERCARQEAAAGGETCPCGDAPAGECRSWHGCNGPGPEEGK